MERILSLCVTVGVGMSMTAVSALFIKAAMKKPSGHFSNGLFYVLGNYYVVPVSTLACGGLILMLTRSMKAAITVMGIVPFLWVTEMSVDSKQQKKRRAVITRELPLLLDHLVLQVESGQSIQLAFKSAPRLFPGNGPMVALLRELSESIQIGNSMVSALARFGQRLDVPGADATILAISQAVKHGTPLGKVLREQSRRMRKNLIITGEQFANTLSIKILVPLLFFIFPASFLVIFSPVIVALTGRFP